jgi:hypothetical protein
MEKVKLAENWTSLTKAFIEAETSCRHRTRDIRYIRFEAFTVNKCAK